MATISTLRNWQGLFFNYSTLGHIRSRSIQIDPDCETFCIIHNALHGVPLNILSCLFLTEKEANLLIFALSRSC